MGIQEYGVRLTPRQGASVESERVIKGLKHLGYRYQKADSPNDVEGAILAAPPQDEIRLVEESRDFIIEAMVKTEAEGTRLKYVSLRFAVCQPASVMPRFLEVVNKLSREYDLTISDGWREHEPESDSLRTALEKEVSARKLRWSQIFDGNREEHKVSVSGAWSLYQANKARPKVAAHR